MNLIHTFISLICLTVSIDCQREFDYGSQRMPIQKEKLIWCVTSTPEEKKCQDWSEAIRRADLDRTTISFEYDLECKRAVDKDQCMNLIENLQAHLVTLDPGEIFVAGRYHSLIPIMSEQYNVQRENGYFSVAVVKTETASILREIRDLRDKKICFTGVGHMASWVLPMARLLDEDNPPLLHIRDCNNMIKSAADFFGHSCAPNSLIDKYNPTGDNPQSMCSLCSSRMAGKSQSCSGSDPYANFEGAFLCLSEVGDVAFLKHTTVDQMTKRRVHGIFSKHSYELLCPYGGRRSIDSYQECNWGYVPSHSVVISSATPLEKRTSIQRFLQQSANRFGKESWQENYFTRTTSRPGRFNQTRLGNQQYPQSQYSASQFPTSNLNTTIGFSLLGDTYVKYGGLNLLFSDETSALVPVEISKQTFAGYLGSYAVPSSVRGGNAVRSFLDQFEKLRKCPVPSARLCVVSDKEVEKCNKMKTAFRSQMLKPELSCIKGHSAIGCMAMIQDATADLAVFDAGDVYTGGQKFSLQPIVAEQYNLNDTNYYVVAIARTSDKDTDLLYLKNKRSCHTGFGLASGWVIPLSFLLSNGRMRSYGCDSARAAAAFFQKSCAPGALSREFYSTKSTWDYGNLCDLCHGESFRFCSRDSSEPFYGDTGALRCLVEGGGEIAFAKHTTIVENTAGRNPQWWARNVIPDDFELLCRDGTRDFYYNYRRCNLGVVSSNAIVTNKYKDDFHKEAYINLFLYAQQFYGSKYSEDFTFKMFVSEDNYHDLIFQDSTQQLKAIPKWKWDYKTYLGHDFLKAMTLVDCTAGANSLYSNLTLLIMTMSILIANFIVH